MNALQQGFLTFTVTCTSSQIWGKQNDSNYDGYCKSRDFRFGTLKISGRLIFVTKVLIHDVIKANHDTVYIAYPGMKRTFDLISLGYWWSGMRNS